MKGVLLAGGNGTRLKPLTRLMNKHLLPVGRHPMISYGIDRLVRAGVTEVLLITNADSLGMYAGYLRDGKEFGIRLTYRVQEHAGGIAEALQLAKGFIAPGDKFIVLLGDNLFLEDLTPYIRSFADLPPGSAKVLLSPVKDARRYGVPVFAPQGGGRLLRIDEKPDIPQSAYAVTGIYMYDYAVFGLIAQISRSARGELEITDVNNLYAAAGKLEYDVLTEWWCDAGTFESLKEASEKMKDMLP